MQDPRAILSELDAVRAETLQRLESATQAQLDVRPAPTPHNSGAWSLGEFFMHIAGDEIYLRELIARPLLEGVLPPEGVGFVPPPPAAGLPKDVIAFWFQRARAESEQALHLLADRVAAVFRRSVRARSGAEQGERRDEGRGTSPAAGWLNAVEHLTFLLGGVGAHGGDRTRRSEETDTGPTCCRRCACVSLS